VALPTQTQLPQPQQQQQQQQHDRLNDTVAGEVGSTSSLGGGTHAQEAPTQEAQPLPEHSSHEADGE